DQGDGGVGDSQFVSESSSASAETGYDVGLVIIAFVATDTDRREELKRVFEQASACTRCPELAATRTNVVFGAGDANADLMFIGEAPGRNEDEQGLPFVGAAGKLLEELLNEIGMDRRDVFIANVLKCRPPGN